MARNWPVSSPAKVATFVRNRWQAWPGIYNEGLEAFDLKEFLSNDEKIREKLEQMHQAESLSSLGRVILERNGQVASC
jgi:hypothetical protein